MKEKQRLIFLLLILITIGLISISYISNIKNPFSVIGGVIKVELKNTIEVIDKKPITLFGKEHKSIEKYMKNLGYEFDFQEGNSYFFYKDSKSVLITSKQFTKRYVIWQIIEQ